jgi:hypothetical protein
VIARYALVASRIHDELAMIARLVERIEAILASAHQSTNSNFYVDAIALNLHDFYTAIERIFRQIAGHLDQTEPKGANWHCDLLRQMTLEVPEVRPAAITKETYRLLDEYLRFRHVVRNAYTFELNAQRVLELARTARDCFERVNHDLLRFAQLLTDLAHADE